MRQVGYKTMNGIVDTLKEAKANCGGEVVLRPIKEKKNIFIGKVDKRPKI